jgi:alpha 1,2-mannosyltransferase
VQWQSLSENYGFNAKDVDFVRYFCNSQSQSFLQQDTAPLASDELDHQKVLYLSQLNSSPPDENIPSNVWDNLPVKGAYYMIVRNEKLGEARAVIKSLENHMANGTRYPLVILNNQHFTEDFKKYVKKVATAPVFFGKIDAEAWEYPHWINVPLAEQLLKDQDTNGVYRGGSLSYHQLLRYQSGFFFHHPLLRDVDYAWRLEPGADYSCKMNEDMFLLMKEQNKKLGKLI